MSASPTSSTTQNLQSNSVYDEELASSSTPATTYLHHLTANQIDSNVSSTQHHQQPYKHILAQKYAAESTSDQANSEHHQLHHLAHFYSYSPLVSSSCTSNHYDANVINVNHTQGDVNVESTGDPLDNDDATSLMNSQSFHDNMMDHLIKQEQVAVTGSGATMVSSTSTSNVCRSDIMFDCTNEPVDSTTNGHSSMSFVSYDSDNKISLEEMVSIQPNAHHLILPAHSSSHFLQHETDLTENEPHDHCRQTLQQFNRLPIDQSQAHVINDLPVLSRARASLPNTYLYIEDTDLANNVCGVFARKTIPKTTQFGPVEGIIVEHNSMHLHHNKQQSFIIFVTESLILDQSDENQSNWMKFVRPANTYEEQNLVLVDKENITEEGIEVKFYFMTIRPINTKEELKVWYSKEYAEKFNLRVLEPMVQQYNECETESTNNNAVKRTSDSSTSSDIPVATGGHKLRNKIAKTQQQLQKYQEETDNQKDSQKNDDKKDDTSAKFQCETCHKTFPRFYSLRRHQIMHSGEKKYKCPICQMSFSHVYNRNRHVKRHAKIKKNNNNQTVQTTEQSNCNDNNKANQVNSVVEKCSSEQNNEKSETISIDKSNCQQMNATEQPVVLPVARKSAPTSFKASNATKSNKPYKCHECYKSFTTDDRLLRHAIVHSSNEDVKPLACQFCQKRFLNNSALSCHLKIHFTPKDQPRKYDCVICKELFDSTQARKDHVITHADPVTGQYTCPNCLKVFDEFPAVRKHIRAFHSDKQYPCTQCEKIFPRPDKLKLHMLRHSDHREFLCANCGKQFKRKDKLKEHMQRMHAPDREAKIAAKQAAKLAQQQSQQHKKFIPKVSPTDYHRFIYKCHTCLLGFKRRGMLVNHLAKRHPDIPPESVPELNLPILKTTRDYYCQYCDKIYKSSSKRKAHIIKNHPGKSLPLSNRHKGGIPVIPGVPNPTYSETVGSITTHPHYCDWCHKQYASKAKLLQHQRKKHPEQMAIINSNARARQRAIPNVPITSTLTTQTTNMVSNTALSSSPVTISPGVATTNLITILASSSDLQELLQSSSATNDLLTQAMSELTATTQCKGDTATLIITAPTADPSWSQVCEDIT